MKTVISLIMSILLAFTGIVGTYKSRYNEEKSSKMDAYTQENKACKENQIVIVGDSITELWGKDDSFKKLSPSLGKEVYARGISGDTSNRLLERLKNNVTNINPSKIVILIGTNDIAYGFMKQATKDNVSKIIKQIKLDCPNAEIYLQAVYPTNNTVVPDGQSKNTMVGKRSNTHIKLLNKKLAEVAKEENISFVDLSSALSDENGNLKAQYTYDGLHPSHEGFEIITQEIIKILK